MNNSIVGDLFYKEFLSFYAYSHDELNPFLYN